MVISWIFFFLILIIILWIFLTEIWTSISRKCKASQVWTLTAKVLFNISLGNQLQRIFTHFSLSDLDNFIFKMSIVPNLNFDSNITTLFFNLDWKPIGNWEEGNKSETEQNGWFTKQKEEKGATAESAVFSSNSVQFIQLLHVVSDHLASCLRELNTQA